VVNRSNKQLVRFGVFELDLEAGELRKQGLRLHLQPKPLQMLALLLERPGEIVTRDELRRRLWDGDIFVDFESGLNTVANRLRLKLGDSAETPRYIETLSRTGYRFIAPVTTDRLVAARCTPGAGQASGCSFPPALVCRGGLRCRRTTGVRGDATFFATPRRFPAAHLSPRTGAGRTLRA